MKRSLVFCMLLPLSGALFAATPPSSAARAESDAAIQRQMADLQTRMHALARQMATLSARIGDDARANALSYLANDHRTMLGIVTHHDRHGWQIEAVTPGGPAAKAGLKTGDVITKVDVEAKRLVATSHAPAPGSPPDPGRFEFEGDRSVRLTVLRNGKTLHFNVVPERMQAADWQAMSRAAEQAAAQATARVDSPAFQQQLQQSIAAAMQSAAIAMKNAAVARDAADKFSVQLTFPWFGLNLAPLNPDLGRYFGTDRGVLVLSRNDNRFSALRPGDVIVAIDGKSVTRPEDALRALREAPEGKPVAVTLRRHDKVIALNMPVPRQWEVLPPLPPPPPVPPTPPIAPTPPTPPAPPPPPSGRAP